MFFKLVFVDKTLHMPKMNCAVTQKANSTIQDRKLYGLFHDKIILDGNLLHSGLNKFTPLRGVGLWH